MTDDTDQTAANADEVLEFDLGTESYCVSIDAVTEIVETGEVTVVPDSPRHLEGVMDLRGTTTAIVNPKVSFGLDGAPGRRIIVFDPTLFEDERSVGWVVDEVRQVVTVRADELNDAPVDTAGVRGLVRRDGDFLIWVEPQRIAA